MNEVLEMKGVRIVGEVKLKTGMLSFQNTTLHHVFPFGTTRLHLRKT